MSYAAGGTCDAISAYRIRYREDRAEATGGISEIVSYYYAKRMMLTLSTKS